MCMYVYVCVCMRMCVYVYVCVCMCMHVYVCVFVCVARTAVGIWGTGGGGRAPPIHEKMHKRQYGFNSGIRLGCSSNGCPGGGG